jgi:F0F1-type ATP synthase assembly protein I
VARSLNPPVKLSLRTARLLSLLVLGGIGIGYLGGAVFAAPDGTTPIGFVGVRLIGLFSAVLLFIEGRGQMTQASDAMLDERERALRDKSYVATHQIMVLTMFAFFLWSIIAKFINGWMPGQEQALDLLSGFAITAMALPGIILAWRERPLDDVD